MCEVQLYTAQSVVVLSSVVWPSALRDGWLVHHNSTIAGCPVVLEAASSSHRLEIYTVDTVYTADTVDTIKTDISLLTGVTLSSDRLKNENETDIVDSSISFQRSRFRCP
jgi:hypothetical protein